MRTMSLGAILALALAWCGGAMAVLPAGISGGWYNPAQSGHGLSIEVLDDRRVVALWYVYDPQGNPVHLYIDGTVAGRGFSGRAYISSGMRFGVFAPQQHVLATWGTIAIDFASCTRARLTYNADGPGGAGYGSGAIDLTRLSALAGQDCRLGTVGALRSGVYGGSVTVAQEQPRAITLTAAVDPDGVLWAAPIMPSDIYQSVVGAFAPLLIGTAVPMDGSRSTVTLTARANLAHGLVSAWRERFGTQASANNINYHADNGRVRELVLHDDAAAADRHAVSRDLSLADVSAHGYRVVTGFLPDAFNAPTLVVEKLSVGSDGGLCVGASTTLGGDFNRVHDDCYYHGAISTTYPGWTFFGFSLKRAGEALSAPIGGRGWVEYQADGKRRVVLVGQSARGGFAVVADQEGAP